VRNSSHTCKTTLPNSNATPKTSTGTPPHPNSRSPPHFNSYERYITDSISKKVFKMKPSQKEVFAADEHWERSLLLQKMKRQFLNL
jgi:hypothetical protein